jgi:arsenate reductase/ArsR family transcriptional regulator
MDQILLIAKALGDPTRLRALRALFCRELCLCQLVALLRLAPSTLSKHLSLLQGAGLVEVRKAGKWHFYRVAGAPAPAVVRDALAWVEVALAGDPTAARDAGTLAEVCRQELEDLACCYRSRDSASPRGPARWATSPSP